MWRRMPGPATCRPSHRPKLQINFVWLKIRQLVRRRSVAGDGRSVDLLLSRTVLLAPRQRVALATQRDSSCQGPWRPQPHGHTAAPSDAVQHTRQRTAWPRRCNRWPGGAPQHALHACVYSINQSTSQPTNQPLGYEKPPLGAPLGRGVLVGQEGLKHLAPAQPAGRPWRNRGGGASAGRHTHLAAACMPRRPCQPRLQTQKMGGRRGDTGALMAPPTPGRRAPARRPARLPAPAGPVLPAHVQPCTIPADLLAAACTKTNDAASPTRNAAASAVPAVPSPVQDAQLLLLAVLHLFRRLDARAQPVAALAVGDVHVLFDVGWGGGQGRESVM